MKRNGFTLMELMIAIAIIAVLSTVGLVIYSKATSKGRDGKRIADLEEVKLALVQYRTVNNGKVCLQDPTTGTCSWRISFFHPVYGDPGSDPNVSLTAILLPKYMQKIPHDPLYSGTVQDYAFVVSADGVQFYITARLDNPPTNPQCNISTIPFRYLIMGPFKQNYCVTE